MKRKQKADNSPIIYNPLRLQNNGGGLDVLIAATRRVAAAERSASASQPKLPLFHARAREGPDRPALGLRTTVAMRARSLAPLARA